MFIIFRAWSVIKIVNSRADQTIGSAILNYVRSLDCKYRHSDVNIIVYVKAVEAEIAVNTRQNVF